MIFRTKLFNRKKVDYIIYVIVYYKKQEFRFMDFESANQYITSPNVARLMISSEDVHKNLWSLFNLLLSTSNPESLAINWQYFGSFTFAVNTIKKDYNINESSILENKNYQHRLCFYFIMHIHH